MIETKRFIPFYKKKERKTKLQGEKGLLFNDYKVDCFIEVNKEIFAYDGI